MAAPKRARIGANFLNFNRPRIAVHSLPPLKEDARRWVTTKSLRRSNLKTLQMLAEPGIVQDAEVHNALPAHAQRRGARRAVRGSRRRAARPVEPVRVASLLGKGRTERRYGCVGGMVVAMVQAVGHAANVCWGHVAAGRKGGAPGPEYRGYCGTSLCTTALEEL